MKKILILTDYRDQFWLTVRHKQASFKIDRLKEEFEKQDYSVQICQFTELDFVNLDYSGVYVVYQSTEDNGLLYNDFITDILMALQEKGAILVPGFRYFRAHHNKVFMEIMRMLSPLQEIRTISSRWFGTYSEYLKFTDSLECKYPQVVKLSAGSGSKNVILIHDSSERERVKKLMWFNDPVSQIKDIIKSFWKSKYPNFRSQTNARKKIIVQNFIPELTGDYKVLAFDKKFFILHRDVRSNDFRASGSGLFKFPEQVSEQLLNFAEKIYLSFNVPFISMDIAETDKGCHLIEFQFVSFGTYTLERAKWHFEHNQNVWEKVDAVCDLETEFVNAVDQYILRSVK